MAGSANISGANMANYYITGHGVIALKKVTPIIHALFCTYRIGPFDASESAACITVISEEHLPDWSDVRASLKALADKLNLALSDGVKGSIGDYIAMFARHFNKADDPFFEKLKTHPFDGTPELDTLFGLASLFDDGHGIENIQYHEHWFCDKVRVGEFNGTSQFISREVISNHDSNCDMIFNACLRRAMVGGDIEKASRDICSAIERLLDCIRDETTRMAVLKKLPVLLYRMVVRKSR